MKSIYLHYFIFHTKQYCTKNSNDGILLTETEEERVNTYGIEAEETVSNQVGTYKHSLMWKT